MKKPNFVNVENAFHVAGFAATAFSAKAALTYLATTFSEGDNITATGFAGIIGLMVASTWTFAFLAKSRQERIKLMALGVLATAISGYTVYQSSIIPLERDAIAKAAEQDRPILAKFNADNNVYRASLDNLQKSIEDLRKQKTSIEADKAAIAKTDKQRDWKQSQLQNKLDALQDSIDRKTNDLKQLVAPVFTATKPDTLPNDKRYPALARAFFYEIAGVAFMLFASLARRNRKEDQQAAANPLLDAIRQLHAAEASANAAVTACTQATRTIATQTATSMEQLVEATTAASTATEHCTQATKTIATQTATSMEQLVEATTAASTAAAQCKDATTEATEVEVNLQKAIRSTEKLFSHANELFAGANRTANKAANITANAGSLPTSETDAESVLYLIKQGLIEPTPDGNLTPKIIMDRAAVGRPTAERLLKEAAQKGYLESTLSGRGITYRYPDQSAIAKTDCPTPQGNIFLLQPRAS